MSGTGRAQTQFTPQNSGGLRLRAAGVACALVFVLLTLDALRHPHAAFDPWLMRAIQRLDAPLLEPTLRQVDRLTDRTHSRIVWAVVVATFVLVRWWLPALVMLVLPIGGVLNFVVNNELVGRERPNLAEMERFVSVDAPAYPSGHVTTAVLLYGYLFVLAHRLDNRAVRGAVRGACLVIVVLSGFGRVWFGAHWPSDVLGSFALGGAVLIAVIAGSARLERGARRPVLSRDHRQRRWW